MEAIKVTAEKAAVRLAEMVNYRYAKIFDLSFSSFVAK